VDKLHNRPHFATKISYGQESKTSPTGKGISGHLPKIDRYLRHEGPSIAWARSIGSRKIVDFLDLHLKSEDVEAHLLVIATAEGLAFGGGKSQIADCRFCFPPLKPAA
jgi:hypothetical protein